MKDIAAFKALNLPQEDFQFSAMVDEFAHQKLDTAPLQDLLNQNIFLSQYGKVKQIGFTPIAIEGDKRHQSITYNEDEASISINIQVDYQFVEQAGTKAEMNAILARYFLAAIPLFTEVPVPNFRISAFREGLFALFQGAGWLNGSLPQVSSPPVYLVWMSNFRGASQKNNRPIKIFARKVARKEWYGTIDAEDLAQWLHQRIELSRFGSGVEELYLSFLADEIDGKTSEPGSTYFREERELHLSVPLNPPSFGRRELLHALAGALPEVERWDIEGFDWEGLRECLVV